MTEWKKTGCALCAQNCGLEVKVENNRLVRSRPDRDNPRSRGYACRKGLNIRHHQHHAGRLTSPLKKTDGRLTEISWERALDEIAERLAGIIETHGPKSLAYVGGGGQGCHFEAAFGVRLMRGLGSRYHYSPLGQELTGRYWVHGRVLGRQNLNLGPDHHRSDVLVAWGWNGWMSHQMPRARVVLSQFSRNPDKTLVSIDPHRSETASRADIHLPVRPGTDALLAKAMAAIIIDKGWLAEEYLAAHSLGLDWVRERLAGFDAARAIRVCGLDQGAVEDLCRLLAESNWSCHYDLGLLMNRHSTLTCYLMVLLQALCGRIGVPGGVVMPGCLMPLGVHTDERQPETWRTSATGFPSLLGVFPPNVLPEEILADGPDRVRAVLTSGSNPLRSYAETAAWEAAFDKLDLAVTSDLALTETAARSHYILPAASAYESWDGTFFGWTWPEVHFQMRRPVVKPEGEPWEVSRIYLELADRLGLIPDCPRSLTEAARGNRPAFGAALMAWLAENPAAKAVLPFVLGKTLGSALGSVNLAALWGLVMSVPPGFRAAAARAGFADGPDQGERIFQALMDNPQGVTIGLSDMDHNLDELKTDSGRLELEIPELNEWLDNLTPESEAADLARDQDLPLVLNAGRHMDMNANTLMRDPAWNTGRRPCTAALAPADAEKLHLTDGHQVRVTTRTGSATLELEIDPKVRPGTVIIPHGFGLQTPDGDYGVNVNLLTSTQNRDPLAATPLHKYVRCRVEGV